MTDIGASLAQMSKRLERLERAARLGYASLDDTALEVRDGNGSLRGIVGQQGDGTTAVNVVNGPPPPQTSAPVVVSVLGGVTVSWDGQFAGGAVMPLDWSRVEVHASPLATYTPTAATLKATVETAQGCTVVIATPDPVYVQLVARSTSGTPSDPSATVGPVGPTPVVASDVLDGIVTTVKLADDAVTAAKVAAAAVTPEALSAVLADTVSQRWTDTMDDPTAWTKTVSTGASWDLVPTTGAPSGGTVGQAAGYVWVRGNTLIPHDPSTLYRVSVRIRTTAQPAAGVDIMYLGVSGFAADKTTLVNRTGANSVNNHYYCVANAQPLATADGWQVFTGYIQGRAGTGISVPGTAANDPLSPAQLHDQVRYMAPYLWFNFTNRDPAGIMQVDSVTVEALRTGVVTAAFMAANSVNTSALVAGSVQAATIAAGAVATDKLAANAVTTAKLAALAVTANEIAANTITAGKLEAGSVDATALKADAITGKVITGGTINGTDINGAVVTGGTVRTGSTGERVVITPTPPAPMVQRATVLMYSGAADEIGPGLMNSGILSSRPNTVVASPATAVDSLGTPVRSTLSLSSPNPGTRKGQFILNAIAPNTSVDVGYAYVDGSTATDASGASAVIITAKDGATTPKLAQLTVTNGRVVADAEAFQIAPTASTAQSAIYVNSPTTHTGNLLRLQHNGVDEFVVDNTGNTTIAGKLTAGNIATGSVTITPSAANTPTSVSVSGLAVQGTTFRAFVSIADPAPGFTATTNGVTGVGFSNLTSSGLTIWATRQNTTAVTVHWMIYGA